MKTVGMGTNKPAVDSRSDSAVKKENAALKKAHQELTAKVTELETQLAEGKSSRNKRGGHPP